MNFGMTLLSNDTPAISGSELSDFLVNNGFVDNDNEAMTLLSDLGNIESNEEQLVFLEQRIKKTGCTSKQTMEEIEAMCPEAIDPDFPPSAFTFAESEHNSEMTLESINTAKLLLGVVAVGAVAVLIWKIFKSIKERLNSDNGQSKAVAEKAKDSTKKVKAAKEDLKKLQKWEGDAKKAAKEGKKVPEPPKPTVSPSGASKSTQSSSSKDTFKETTRMIKKFNETVSQQSADMEAANSELERGLNDLKLSKIIAKKEKMQPRVPGDLVASSSQGGVAFNALKIPDGVDFKVISKDIGRAASEFLSLLLTGYQKLNVVIDAIESNLDAKNFDKMQDFTNWVNNSMPTQDRWRNANNAVPKIFRKVGTNLETYIKEEIVNTADAARYIIANYDYFSDVVAEGKLPDYYGINKRMIDRVNDTLLQEAEKFKSKVEKLDDMYDRANSIGAKTRISEVKNGMKVLEKGAKLALTLTMINKSVNETYIDEMKKLYIKINDKYIADMMDINDKIAELQ